MYGRDNIAERKKSLTKNNMCNAQNHDPWCPCGWGPIKEFFGEMDRETICKILSPFQPALKSLYESAKEPIEDFYTAYQNMGRICDRLNQLAKTSGEKQSELKDALDDADEKMETYDKQKAELEQKLENAESDEDKNLIAEQIASLETSINNEIKSKGLTYLDKKGTKHEVETIDDINNHRDEIDATGLNEYYSGVGKCDGLVRDVILRDIVGVDLNKTGEKVIGVKNLFDYCRNNEIDSPMNEEVYKYCDNNDKEGFKKALTKLIFPGSILFRDGHGSGQLHTGEIVKVTIENGEVESVIMVHAAHEDIESGGIKPWTITSNELWSKCAPKFTLNTKDDEGNIIATETYRRLFISNIGLHKKLNK